MPDTPRSNPLGHKHKNTPTHAMSFIKIHVKVRRNKVKKKQQFENAEAPALPTAPAHLWNSHS